MWHADDDGELDPVLADEQALPTLHATPLLPARGQEATRHAPSAVRSDGSADS